MPNLKFKYRMDFSTYASMIAAKFDAKDWLDLLCMFEWEEAGQDIQDSLEHCTTAQWWIFIFFFPVHYHAGFFIVSFNSVEIKSKSNLSKASK